MKISEPMTLFTDYILAAYLIFLGRKLLTKHGHTRLGYISGFFSLGIAAFLGGTYHGFTYIFPALVLIIIRGLMFVAIFLFNYFILLGSLLQLPASYTTPRLQRLIQAKLLIFVLWSLLTFDFLVVIFDTAPTFLFLIWKIYQSPSRSNQQQRWTMMSFSFGLFAMLVFLLEVSPHPNFNENDLAHVILLGSVYALFRALASKNGIS